MRNQLIVGLVLFIIAGIFAKFKIFDDKVELKYSLSEKIPSDFIDSIQDSGIQQLKIKNSGDVLIKNIVIKINGDVQELKINKFKSTDSVTTSESPNYSELIYPELPPSGEIIILLKLIGSNIDNGKIEIIHSKGYAYEAFTDRKSYWNIVLYITVAVYFTLILISIKKIMIDGLNSTAENRPLGVLYRKKPWFVDSSKWTDIRKTAISNVFLKSNYSFSIEKSNCFQFLNSEKNPFLTESEWSELLDEAERKFRSKVTEKIYQSYYNQIFDEMLFLEKPNNISREFWKEIKKEVSKAFSIHKMNEVFRLQNYYSIPEFLISEKPNIVTEDDWINLKTVLSRFYVSSIFERGIINISDDKSSNNVNLDFIDAPTKKRIIKLLEKVKEGNQKEEYFEKLLQESNNMFYWDQLPDKPDEINIDDWRRIEELYNRAVKKQKDAIISLKEAEKIKLEFRPLKDKVSKQLEIIDNILNEPSSVEKVESYNNPFASGNWRNIQKVAELLSSNL